MNARAIVGTNEPDAVVAALDAAAALRKGDVVRHERHGEGIVIKFWPAGDELLLPVVRFASGKEIPLDERFLQRVKPAPALSVGQPVRLAFGPSTKPIYRDGVIVRFVVSHGTEMPVIRINQNGVEIPMPPSRVFPLDRVAGASAREDEAGDASPGVAPATRFDPTRNPIHAGIQRDAAERSGDDARIRQAILDEDNMREHCE